MILLYFIQYGKLSRMRIILYAYFIHLKKESKSRLNYTLEIKYLKGRVQEDLTKIICKTQRNTMNKKPVCLLPFFPCFFLNSL